MEGNTLFLGMKTDVCLLGLCIQQSFSYHSTSCHVNQDTFPCTQISTVKKH